VAFYPQARWQRCVVHWYRNIFSEVSKTKVKEVAAMLKAIYAREDAASAQERATAVVGAPGDTWTWIASRK
jgi:transposase-like protein